MCPLKHLLYVSLDLQDSKFTIAYLLNCDLVSYEYNGAVLNPIPRADSIGVPDNLYIFKGQGKEKMWVRCWMLCSVTMVPSDKLKGGYD
jgi:hypothetical protein